MRSDHPSSQSKSQTSISEQTDNLRSSQNSSSFKSKQPAVISQSPFQYLSQQPIQLSSSDNRSNLVSQTNPSFLSNLPKESPSNNKSNLTHQSSVRYFGFSSTVPSHLLINKKNIKQTNSLRKYALPQSSGKKHHLQSTIKQMKRAVLEKILFIKTVNVIVGPEASVNNKYDIVQRLASSTHNTPDNINKANVNIRPHTQGQDSLQVSSDKLYSITPTDDNATVTYPEIKKTIYYIIDEYLGDGTFGAVSRIKLLTQQQINQVHATKSFDMSSLLGTPVDNNRNIAYKRVFEESSYQNREIQILKTLNHPNIVKLFGYNYSDLKSKRTSDPNSHNTNEENIEDTDAGQFANLYLEYIPYTLSTFLNNSLAMKTPFTLAIFKSLFSQSLLALNYLHEKNICHRDIKPDNILITKNYKVKICDFGSAKIINKSSKNNLKYITSRPYRAPENLIGMRNYSTLIDIWSLGVVFLETYHCVLYNNNPENTSPNRLNVFIGQNANEVLIDILVKLKVNKSDMKHMKVSQSVQRLITQLRENQCLKTDLDILPNPDTYTFSSDNISDMDINNIKMLKEVLENCICFNYKKRYNAAELLKMKYFFEP
ncbi:putative serine/threonine-protein kinase MRK1 like protein [Cucumispora dikerogammari]|nr:putative serine/threonine-protein kinase MRK1 like protein [Cucumispora dikerogammari]